MNADDTFRRGCEFHRLGKMEDAEKCYRDVLRYQPEHAEAWHHLGLIAHHMGRNDLAVQWLNKAAELSPKDPYVRNNLGEAYRALGRGGDAIACYEAAIERGGTLAIFYNNMGIVMALLGRMTEAINCWTKAIELDPDYAEAHNNLGNVYLEQSMIEKAVECHRKAIKLKPYYTAAHSNLLRDLNHVLDMTGEQILEEHREFWRVQTANIQQLTHKNTRDPERPLRVGYISPDFREHSVAFYFEPILSRHDRSKFQAFCYAHVVNPDAVTARLRTQAYGWRSIVGVNDDKLAQFIQEDQIDILIELAGHTAQNRMMTLAYKPAPVQASFLGYPFTTGGSVVDWKITDPYADPEGMTEKFYSERLLRLPKTAWCYRPAPMTPGVGPLPATFQPSNPFTFGSFNSYAKVSPVVVDMWARILLAMPAARLFLKANGLSNATTQEHIFGMFEARGVPRNRLILMGKEPTTVSHLARYSQVDLALDTYPYDGTTTTCESMWMGVPVVSLAGNHHISRVGFSLLTNVGLTELIAQTPDEYVDIAVKLASDLPRLAAMRAGLRDRMLRSPLMDEEAFVRGFEDALRRAWRDWCSSDRP